VIDRARTAAFAASAGLILFCASCARPSQANIQLRKENQQLQGKLDTAERELAALKTPRVNVPATGPIIDITAGQFGPLFTVGKIELKPLTGGDDFDGKPGDDGVKVYLTPIDVAGDKIKAAGWITIDLFDLQKSGDQRISHCEYTPEQAKQYWYSLLTLYEYIVPCKWQAPPQHSELTVRVTFIDALTRRKFDAQKVVNVKLPPK